MGEWEHVQNGSLLLPVMGKDGELRSASSLLKSVAFLYRTILMVRQGTV